MDMSAYLGRAVICGPQVDQSVQSRIDMVKLLR
ncbi:unnamed protein product, partial [marine sediment metagenome]